jgi:ATP-dependent exoDNAse (exonuclease V) alpha subunit
LELQVGDAAFARGDRVVVKRNDARLGVTNGERGVVIAVDDEHQRLAVQLSDDVVTLDHAFLTTPTAKAIRRSPTATRSRVTWHRV